MFPETEDETFEIVSSAEALGTVFLFDFNKRCYVLRDGKPVVATYEEAIKQYVTMLLITEVDKYNIYKENSFGVEVTKFIGRRDLTTGVIASEVKRQLEEKLILHPEINGIQNFSVSRSSGLATISFDVVTNQGIISGVTSEVKDLSLIHI